MAHVRSVTTEVTAARRVDVTISELIDEAAKKGYEPAGGLSVWRTHVSESLRVTMLFQKADPTQPDWLVEKPKLFG